MANRQRKDLDLDEWEEYDGSSDRRQRMETKNSRNRYDRGSTRNPAGRHGRGSKPWRDEW